jgi:hypothetical protein
MNKSSSFLPNVHIQTATTAVFSTIIVMLLRTVNPVAVTVYSNPTFWDRTLISYFFFGGGGAQQPYSDLGRMFEVLMSHTCTIRGRNPLDERSGRVTSTWQCTTLTGGRHPCPPAVIEPVNPTSERPQRDAFDRAATGISILWPRTDTGW